VAHPRRRRRPRPNRSPLAAITTESLAVLGCLGLLLWTSAAAPRTDSQPTPAIDLDDPYAADAYSYSYSGGAYSGNTYWGNTYSGNTYSGEANSGQFQSDDHRDWDSVQPGQRYSSELDLGQPRPARGSMFVGQGRGEESRTPLAKINRSPYE
jgi:hypothetical protein